MSQMRLSEAIRLGAMSRPQAFGIFFSKDTGGTCALGAALEAIGGLDEDDPLSVKHNLLLRRRFPVLLQPLSCPACGGDIGGDEMSLAHLNDTHKWSRERIADWLETVEGAARDSSGVAQEQAQASSVALCAPK